MSEGIGSIALSKISLGSPASSEAMEHSRWFVRLRWITVGVGFILSFVAVEMLHILPGEVWWPLIGTVGALAALNIGYTVALRFGTHIKGLNNLQAYLDLILLTVLIHFSGGIENPLVLLMIFHVIIAGITLSRKECFSVALGASILFALLALGEMSEILDHYTLQLVPHYQGEHDHTMHAAHDAVYVGGFIGLQTTILMLTAVFVTSLADRLRVKERELANLARRALTQSQLLERSLETTRTGLCVFDPTLSPVLTNPMWDSWERQLQADPQQYESVFETEGPIRSTLSNGESSVIEVVLGLDVGDEQSTKRTFQVTLAPLTDGEGSVTHVVALLNDVTEAKAAQVKMVQAGRLAAVGELAGKVAHEINNPITIVRAKAQLLLSDHREELSDRTAEELQKIVDASGRVAKIASGLLSSSRPSAAPPSPVDLTIPARRALDMIRTHASNTGIAIEDDLSPTLPLTVANSREMEQVFLNLYLNALDAMPEGGSLVVSSNVRTEPNATPQIDIIIADVGAGMTPEVHERAFEPFFTTKADGKGTGLGLSICQGLVQNYGGVVRLDSEVGRGTTVTVSLPVSPDQEINA